MTQHLSSEQLSEFSKTGFLVIKGLFNNDEIHELSQHANEILNGPEIPGRIMKYFEKSRDNSEERILNRAEDFCPHVEYLDRLAKGKLMEISTELFGEEAVLFKDKINFKLPGGDGFAAHQDVQAGWDSYATIHITAMLSLDATTRENGYLEIIPGLHQQGLLGKMWEPLKEDETPADQYIPCPTSPGDVVFFDSYAPHRSAPNTSKSTRRVFYLTYNRAAEGDHLRQYYTDKRKNYPPDCEREAGKSYRFKV